MLTPSSSLRLQAGFLALLVGLLAAGCTHASPKHSEACTTNVDSIAVATIDVSDSRTSILADSFANDQRDRALSSQRQLTDAEWQEVEHGDDVRLAEAVRALASPNSLSVRDLYYASVILLHGTCAEHYRLARDLAERAMGLGVDEAKSIFANATDRHLLSIDQPQKYGTQYDCNAGDCTLLPYDLKTTDAERIELDVPPMTEGRGGG
ncbi:MAG: hypothetical protein ACREPD_14810 [Stenotrophomonas sp.]|uniref:hypothetical protein n=1 Tax=Stenotrophomonas sp. TaxID=69392 RepID=UPI003D6D627D